MSEPITIVLPAELVEQIAERVAQLLGNRARETAATGSPWLNVEGACAYLGFSRDTLYKLTAAKAIPFRRKQGGQGLLFHRQELDEWVALNYAREDHTPVPRATVDACLNSANPSHPERA